MGAFLLLTSLLTGTALAKPPTYGQSFTATPDPVSYNGLVRFDVTWTNLSGANLPTVYTSAVTPSGADLIAAIDVSQGSCDASAADLSCSFGTVNNGAFVHFAAIYQVPSSGSSFSVKFVFTAQGNTGSDTPGRSRGDDMPITATVALTNAAGVGSSYVYDGYETVQNTQNLSKRNNPQSAKLDFDVQPGDPGFGATVSEAAASSDSCPPLVTTCFGDWTILSVNAGNQIPGGMAVTLGYFQVPNGSAGGFVHWLTNNRINPVEGIDYELIDDACTYTGGVVDSLPCIDEVTTAQGNTFFVVLMDQNGSMRGY